MKKIHKIYIKADMFPMGCEPEEPIYEDQNGTFYKFEECRRCGGAVYTVKNYKGCEVCGEDYTLPDIEELYPKCKIYS